MTTWASGRCLCEAVTYTLSHRPLIVHACHCRDCQRITGSPFVVNAWVVEADLALAGALERRSLSSGSGKGQELSTCAACGCALFTRYLLTPPGTVFRRDARRSSAGAARREHLRECSGAMGAAARRRARDLRRVLRHEDGVGSGQLGANEGRGARCRLRLRGAPRRLARGPIVHHIQRRCCREGSPASLGLDSGLRARRSRRTRRISSRAGARIAAG